MSKTSHNLRKAAVLIRSLDADTAAKLLAQLEPAEANAVRAAIRTLGDVDPEEQADVASELRRAKPLASQPAALGVELHLTSDAGRELDAPQIARQYAARRFDFLEDAPIEALGQFLSREHVQTVAVVLSYLAPQRAAAVLATLPEVLQAETIERLSTLGETDPDNLSVIERELSAWLAKRGTARTGRWQRGDSVTSILVAADAATRDRILVSLKTHKAPLAKQLESLLPITGRSNDAAARPVAARNTQAESLGTRKREFDRQAAQNLATATPKASQTAPVSAVATRPPQAPCFAFDELALLSTAELGAVLRDVDAGVLVLALTGSSDELVDRVCEPMPRRTAKAFRRQLSRLGPTRLSDVEAAQQMVAAAAARRIAERKSRVLAAS